jgi:serine/threonine protein kinase
MRASLPDKGFFPNKPVPGFSGYRIIEWIGSGVNAHVFKAKSDFPPKDWALKIIPKENLVGYGTTDQKWKQEVLKVNSLRSPLVVQCTNVTEWVDSDNSIDCIVLWYDFIPGLNLEKHLKANGAKISVAFAQNFLRDMLGVLDDMQKKGIQHGDLHSKNILVEDRQDLLGIEPFVFRITDFGVATATSEPNFKDDFEQTGAILREILERVNYQASEPRLKYTFDVLNNDFIGKHLFEKDPSRDPLAKNPRKMFDRFGKITQEFNELQRNHGKTELLSPFDYLSCEHIHSDSLLKALYSSSLLGLELIEGGNNVILTGPRGCGKSTVFKCLSLRHKNLVQDDNPENVKFIGIYYRCDDLYAFFPRYVPPKILGSVDIPIHYVIAALSHELLQSVEKWANRFYQDEFKEKENSLSEKIWALLEIDKPKEPGVNRFQSICFSLQEERKRAAKSQRFANVETWPHENYFGPALLRDICDLVSSELTFIRGKNFYFFIDDYSIPKITADLQKNLNRLFMQRTSSCFFKISTESPVSYVREDIDGKAYVESREFVLLNLSLSYLDAEKSEEKTRFIQDVFARRFKAIPSYPVSDLLELIGDYSRPSFNEIALAYRRKENPDLWGIQNLSDLCSGDIFYILKLVGRMVADAGGQEFLAATTDTPKVNKEIQKKAIRSEAGSFLESLRGIDNGEHLVSVVTAFGVVAASYQKHLNSSNEKGNPPHLASRIEPYDELTLADNAKNVYRELLRYSLLIEDPRGKSRRGKVVPRLYLRRCLLPSFNLTFGKRDSIQLEVSEIERLLLNPEEFQTVHRKRQDQAEIENKNSGQIGLFDKKEGE